MKNTIFTLALLLFTLSSHLETYAQHMLGISNSNYAGTHGIVANPSYAADSRHGFYLNLFSASGYGSNTHYTWSGPFSIPKFFMEGEDWSKEYKTAADVDKPASLRAGADVRGPSFLLKLNAKSGLAIHTRARGTLQADNLSPGIMWLLREGIDQEEYLNQPFRDNTFKLNANVVSEIGMTYARTIWEDDQHFIKAGFTAKRLFGAYSVHMAVDAMDFDIKQDQHLNNFMEVGSIRAQYGYSTRQHFEDVLDPRNTESWGRGWGIDLGFTYEHRPNVGQYRSTVDGIERLDNSKNKYDYKISLTILDIGGINYNSSSSRTHAFDRSNFIISQNHIDDLGDDFVDVVKDVFDVGGEEIQNSFRSSLPTALRIDLDYRLAKKIYTSFTVLQDLKGRDAKGIRENSMVALTPRIETRGFELAFPVSLTNNYQNFGLGSYMRLGILFLGSDNLANVLGVGKTYGADVYLGLALPFVKRETKSLRR